MKNNYLFKSVFILTFLLATLLFYQCEIDFFTDQDNSSGAYGTIIGTVSDLQANPLADVKVNIGNLETYSNQDGSFSISDIPIGDKLVVSFELADYSPTQKIADIEDGKSTFLSAAMGKWDVLATIDVTQANKVSFQNASVDLPANGVVDKNGQLVSGNITVKASYFDPMSDTYGEVFPGEFEGLDASGNSTSIESFGFINVELFQGNNELDLAPGEVSEIIIPLPAALLANAPATIPLWYFDEVLGTWVEEGTATKQNGEYIGTVSHFTAWNCDQPINSSTIRGKVTCEDGTPIEGARVIAKGVDYSASRRVETESDGSYEVAVKADASVDIYALVISAFGTVIAQSQTVRTSTPGGEQTKTIEDLIIKCDTTTVSYSRLYDLTTDFPYSYDYGRAIAVGESGWIVSYDWVNDVWVRKDAGTVEAFYGIDCPAWNSLWAVGSNGTVRFSDDIGENWTPILIGTDADLFDIEFYNAYYGWIVGSTGKIFRTIDAGANWTPESSGTVQTLYDGAFVSKNEGWVCGTSNGTFGTILHTIDGGVSWQSQTSNTFENLRGIEFIDSSRGWAVGENGAIVMTQDGGQTWTPQTSGTLEDLNGIDFANQKYGTIVGNNGIYLQSNDGGSSWTSSVQVPANNLEAVDYRSRHAWGIVVGDDNIFDINGGTQDFTQGWVLQSNEPEKLRDIEAVSETEAWTVGDNGILLKTTDAGNTWIPSNFNGTESLYTIEMVGDNIWVGGNNNNLYKSEDRGLTWVSQLTFTSGYRINKIQFIDALNGYYKMYDTNYGYDYTDIYKTINGGQTWNKISKPSTYISDMYFIDQNTGWACGPNEISETSDGGISWQTVSLDFEGNNYSDGGNISVFNNDLIWLTSGSNLYHAEKGKPWYGKFIDFNDGYTLQSLEFTDAQTGWAIDVFISGDIVKTINGGKTWYTQRSGHFESLDMVNNNVGWIVGKNGEILYTTTGGE